jgi:hypothetical protein
VKPLALVPGQAAVDGDPSGRRDTALMTWDTGQTVKEREGRTAKGMLDISEAKSFSMDDVGHRLNSGWGWGEMSLYLVI